MPITRGIQQSSFFFWFREILGRKSEHLAGDARSRKLLRLHRLVVGMAWRAEAWNFNDPTITEIRDAGWESQKILDFVSVESFREIFLSFSSVHADSMRCFDFA